MKIAAVTILCMIFFVQFFIAIRAAVRRKLGCAETVVVTMFTVFLYSLLFIASCS